MNNSNPKNTTLRATCSPLKGIALFCLFATGCTLQAVAADPIGVTQEELASWVVAEPNQVIELEPVTNSAVVVSGAGADILVTPGLHTVNGDFTLDAKDSNIVIAFNRKKVSGHLDVKGTLLLGPENYPALSLSMENARFAKGDKFIICSAQKIVGEFAGLGNDSKIEKDGLTVMIHYSGEEITLTVTDVSKHNYPSATPIVEISSDLIDPTSTSPFF